MSVSTALKYTKKLYEDKRVIVVKGLTEKEIEDAVMDFISSRGVASIHDLKIAFSNIVSEDRLRRILKRLVYDGRLVKLKKIYYAMPP